MKAASYNRLAAAYKLHLDTVAGVTKKVETAKSSEHGHIHFIEAALSGDSLAAEVRSVLLADTLDPAGTLNPDTLRERLLGAITMYEAVRGAEPTDKAEVRAADALVSMIRAAVTPTT